MIEVKEQWFHWLSLWHSHRSVLRTELFELDVEVKHHIQYVSYKKLTVSFNLMMKVEHTEEIIIDN